MAVQGVKSEAANYSKYIDAFFPYLRDNNQQGCLKEPKQTYLTERKKYMEYARYWELPFPVILAALAGDFQKVEAARIDKNKKKLCYLHAAANGYKLAYGLLNNTELKESLIFAVQRGYLKAAQRLWKTMQERSIILTPEFQAQLLEESIGSGSKLVFDWLLQQVIPGLEERGQQDALIKAVSAKQKAMLWQMWPAFSEAIDFVTLDLLLQESWYDDDLAADIKRLSYDLPLLQQSVPLSPAYHCYVASESSESEDALNADSDLEEELDHDSRAKRRRR